MTRFGDLLDFGQVFKAFGNNKFAQISHILWQFLYRCQNLPTVHASYLDMWLINRRRTALAQYSNMCGIMPYVFCIFCHFVRSLPLGPIKPSSPSTKELHALDISSCCRNNSYILCISIYLSYYLFCIVT